MRRQVDADRGYRRTGGDREATDASGFESAAAATGESAAGG